MPLSRFWRFLDRRLGWRRRRRGLGQYGGGFRGRRHRVGGGGGRLIRGGGPIGLPRRFGEGSRLGFGQRRLEDHLDSTLGDRLGHGRGRVGQIEEQQHEANGVSRCQKGKGQW